MPLPENELKEELSYAYVHTLAARAGFSCDRPGKDRQSTDVIVNSEGLACEDALLRQAHLGLQLKATARELPEGDFITFSLPINNYNDLRIRNAYPKLLVVFVLPPNSQHWQHHLAEEELISRRCAYFLNLFGQPEVPNTDSRTVHIPRANLLTLESLQSLMAQSSRLELQDAT
jgi:hypothetical protein